MYWRDRWNKSVWTGDSLLSLCTLSQQLIPSLSLPRFKIFASIRNKQCLKTFSFFLALFQLQFRVSSDLKASTSVFFLALMFMTFVLLAIIFMASLKRSWVFCLVLSVGTKLLRLLVSTESSYTFAHNTNSEVHNNGLVRFSQYVSIEQYIKDSDICAKCFWVNFDYFITRPLFRDRETDF